MTPLFYLNPYTFHISLYDLTLLAALFIAIDFFLLLWFSRKIKQPRVVPRETAASRPPIPAELLQKGAWLKKAMEVNLFYQDTDLSLRSLAETLDLHPNELSRIINTAFGKNFNDFINEYRIREVIIKMQDPAYDRITLLGIAMDAGFNSKSTFNRTFRAV